MTPEQERIWWNLPAWVKDRFDRVKRERDAAINALQKCADDADASTAALYWAEQFGVKGIE